MLARAVYERPGNLPRVVDAESIRPACAGHIDLGERAPGIEEAVGACAVVEGPHDLSRIVDAENVRKCCAGTSIWVKV